MRKKCIERKREDEMMKRWVGQGEKRQRETEAQSLEKKPTRAVRFNSLIDALRLDSPWSYKPSPLLLLLLLLLFFTLDMYCIGLVCTIIFDKLMIHIMHHKHNVCE
jgi:hypothetical protein